MKRITRAQAEQLLRGCAIIPGAEELVLKSMGYEIAEARINLRELKNKSIDEYTRYTLDGLTEGETENYLVAAGAVMGRYSGRMTGGIGKWRLLFLEFARKDNLEKIVSLELANLPVTTSHSTHFNGRNCSIIGARIDIIGKDIVNANYLNPEGKVLESFKVDLNQRYE